MSEGLRQPSRQRLKQPVAAVTEWAERQRKFAARMVFDVMQRCC